MEALKLRKDPQAFHYTMQGDKQKQIEPPEVYLHFPGGYVGVARCNDEEYWIHMSLEDVNENSNAEFKGQLIDSRIDCKNMSTCEADKGDLAREDLHHVAIKVRCLPH